MSVYVCLRDKYGFVYSFSAHRTEHSSIYPDMFIILLFLDSNETLVAWHQRT